jgi:hypothetical protein
MLRIPESGKLLGASEDTGFRKAKADVVTALPNSFPAIEGLSHVYQHWMHYSG